VTIVCAFVHIAASLEASPSVFVMAEAAATVVPLPMPVSGILHTKLAALCHTTTTTSPCTFSDAVLQLQRLCYSCVSTGVTAALKLHACKGQPAVCTCCVLSVSYT
jgi:hypothetical protein